jgi:hypothetical protein
MLVHCLLHQLARHANHGCLPQLGMIMALCGTTLLSKMLPIQWCTYKGYLPKGHMCQLNCVCAAVRAVYPVAGPPGQQVQVLGRSTYTLQSDCTAEAKSFNDNSCVGEVKFGDYLCSTGAGTNDAAAVSSFVSPGRWNSDSMYAISCTLPDPSTQLDQSVSEISFPFFFPSPNTSHVSLR